MVILCANTMTPYFGKSQLTGDGVEEEWGINYLANFHLLSILSPAIRAQPPDRDVRVLFSTCASYIGGELDLKTTETASKSGSASYRRSKLATMVFANAFQKHLDAYERPDKSTNNARAFLIDPGLTRTPGMRRWLTGGSLIGLLIYMLTYSIWWLVLKSPTQGAQSYLFAAMDAEYGRGTGARLIKECREYEPLRGEVRNEEVAKGLWEFSEKQIEQLEKEGALKRNEAKKRKKEGEKKSEKETHENGSVEGSGKQEKKAGSRRNKKAK
jgi:NAD(P)-dependent dehydrogenase (short-subunit alcohol dehydrogenase family)